MRIHNQIRQLVASVASVLMLVMVLSPTMAFADSSKVVTIGADLTPQQRQTVLEFFGLTEDDLADMEVITVTNQDERSYLDGTVSTTEIGTKTLSCSYIEPTTSGGINVETANLTYVTKDVLYNALQTAGIENCNLVVTAPYHVSGTGALTGVFMAYEQNGQTLDENKKAAATEEMVDTANLETKYGEEAPEVVSEVKDKVASSDAELSDDQIRDLIRIAAKAKGINLSDEDVDTILAIAKKVQDMDYDRSSFANTLEQAKDGITDASEQATGVIGAIQSFFESIGDFFAKLFGIASDKAEEGKGIISNLNTDIYQLDSGDTKNENVANDPDADQGGNTVANDATPDAPIIDDNANATDATSTATGQGTFQGTATDESTTTADTLTSENDNSVIGGIADGIGDATASIVNNVAAATENVAQ